MELLLSILFMLLLAWVDGATAIAIVLGLCVGVIVVTSFSRWRNGLRFPAGPAKADALLDGSAVIELARRSEQPLVAFEWVYDGAAQRVTIFSRTANRLHSPRYCWIAKDVEGVIRAHVHAAGIRTATADGETYGPWLVHTDDHDPPIVWASNVKDGCALIELHGCWVIRHGRQRRAIDKSAIVGVEAWASPTWLRHEVRLHVKTKFGIEVVTVAHKLQGRAIADGFYDGLDFLWDSGWALGLGRELADHLALPLTRSGELKD